MKKLLAIVAVAILGFFAYKKFTGGDGPPQPIDDPVYGEVRVEMDVKGRVIEAALFFRASGTADCNGRALVSWTNVFKNCAQCSLQKHSCQDQLPARYARLFDDEPIASPYLAANAGRDSERDGRIVVYGLTDEEGIAFCEGMRKAFSKSYQGETYCVKASGN